MLLAIHTELTEFARTAAPHPAIADLASCCRICCFVAALAKPVINPALTCSVSIAPARPDNRGHACGDNGKDDDTGCGPEPSAFLSSCTSLIGHLSVPFILCLACETTAVWIRDVSSCYHSSAKKLLSHSDLKPEALNTCAGSFSTMIARHNHRKSSGAAVYACNPLRQEATQHYMPALIMFEGAGVPVTSSCASLTHEPSTSTVTCS